MDMAIFHLCQAMMPVYNSDEVAKGRKLATSWEELILDTKEYRGSHMAGTLLSAYPLLGKPLDPWGHPWVYRIVEFDCGDFDSAWLEITFGSLGPDGIECPSSDADYDIRRRTCDDLLGRYRIVDVPRSLVPRDTPLEPAPPVEIKPPLW